MTSAHETSDSLVSALAKADIPTINHEFIRDITSAVGILSYHAVSASTSYVVASRRDGGPDLHIHYGYTNGFTSEEEIVRVAGSGPVRAPSSRKGTWYVGHPENALRHRDGSSRDARREAGYCSCGMQLSLRGSMRLLRLATRPARRECLCRHVINHTEPALCPLRQGAGSSFRFDTAAVWRVALQFQFMALFSRPWPATTPQPRPPPCRPTRPQRPRHRGRPCGDRRTGHRRTHHRRARPAPRPPRGLRDRGHHPRIHAPAAITSARTAHRSDTYSPIGVIGIVLIETDLTVESNRIDRTPYLNSGYDTSL